MVLVVRESTGPGRPRVVQRGTITVVLADGHGFVRALLRTLLDAEHGLTVVGEAGNSLDASRIVRTLRPNVAVIDMAMPGMNGPELARLTRDCSRKTGVVIYSFYTGQDYQAEAKRAGARAWVSKSSSLDDLVLAIREVASGRTHFGPGPQPAEGPRPGRRRAHPGHHTAVHRHE